MFCESSRKATLKNTARKFTHYVLSTTKYVNSNDVMADVNRKMQRTNIFYFN